MSEPAADTAVSGGSADLDRWWGRIQPFWHLMYLGLLGLAALTTILDSRLAGAERPAMIAVLGVMAATYLVLGVRLFESPGGVRAAAYLTVTWLCFYSLVLISDGATNAYFVLFALFPQIWAYLASRAAVAVSLVVILGEALVELHIAGWGWGMAVRHAPLSVMQAGLVLLLGLLMVGITTQAERRAALIDELAATRSELAETERARGVLAERERLAHEIHDTLAQGFTSVLTLAQAIEAALEHDPAAARSRLKLLERTARENLDETRALIDALAPVDLQEAPLPEAIERVARRFADETGTITEVVIDGDQQPMPLFAEVVLLRSAQEALSNVAKHAGADTVTVTLSYVPDGVGLASVTVVDDGRGFVVDDAAGFGLRGMRTRAQQAGGGMEIVSAPGAGTTVRVHVPAVVIE